MQKFFYLCFLLNNLIKEKIKKKIIQLDNEHLAIGLISILGLVLLLPLLIIAPGLFESEWFLNFITVPAEYGSFLADAGYFGRLLNLCTARPYANGNQTKITNFLNQEIIIDKKIGYAEKLFTPIGMLLGVSLGIFCVSLHAIIPFWHIFSYFAYILFILGYACLLGGLFNRLASSFDGARLKQEKISIFVGVVLGLIIAISLLTVLMITGSIPFVVVIGISKPFIDLLILHKFLFALPFVVSLTSITTSCFDYFSKAYCFLIYLLGTEDESVKLRITSRYYEYKSAFFGIGFGCLLALGITLGLCITGSLIASPIAIAATIFTTIIICNNVLAALFSRLGRFIDGIKQISSRQAEKICENGITLTSEFECINTINDQTSKRTYSLLSLPLTFSCTGKDQNHNQQRFKLSRTQSSPAFFCAYYKLKKETHVDNEFFFESSGSLSSLII